VIEHPDLTLDESRARLAADGIQTGRLDAPPLFSWHTGGAEKKARGAEAEARSCDPFHEE
jgi:hypothetical protein